VITKLWSESGDLFEQTLVSKRRYDLNVGGRYVRSEVHAHRLRWYFHHEAAMMLERAGFVDVVTHGDHTDDPADQRNRIEATNALLSLLLVVVVRAAGYLYSGALPSATAVFSQLSAVALSVGFALSAYVSWLCRRHERPMYDNFGLRLPIRLAVAYGLHAAAGG
jgi:hypothetical protein